MKNLILFCDFDGTITSKDNIIEIMKKFAPEEWVTLKDQVLAEEIAIKDGVGKMFNLLPSSLKEDMTEYVLENAQIRDGFSEFVLYAKEHNIPLYIVSGGIDFFVHPILSPYIEKGFIYCNEGDFSGENVKIRWPHSCDSQCNNGCGCCKPSLLRTLQKDEAFTIVIGDSVTDLQAAKQADYVIARDYLLEKCEKLELPHASFDTFYDVISEIKQVREELK
ncbi:2-hydroxy-3-keto-5-methylthiopentenyl-1-phosphate phosphatase [Priestia endophytica]|uniref:2-hydroxy-3-keto-5-methylthiopentenyl-1-phosphate phosphatase n=1 Tax=Priestia endophytica TaxID=135735 RepID=A0AAX1Q1U3_9BACI|nr:2-hydroxy-3-keto-5-methylthiopentenyl-1-phosphate phosphatase [Priestia endophytica]RAS72190.1 2-hydroxy-3-keto-5-methylthiopentenyl-1-phosphate phosphatase [Priestia endophytica]RAS89826.1 2-hydroxy-3-keto-5-methylthiopentenyl-1-phosphate phosphatase [Priestia endophytica]